MTRTSCADLHGLHVLCYVYLGAWAAGADEARRWSTCLAWLRACWQGRVKEVIEELRTWQGRIGEAGPRRGPHHLQFGPGETGLAEGEKSPPRGARSAC